jgi:hypothetical protein
MQLVPVDRAGLGVAILFSIALCGCVVRYEDVSNKPEYASLLNARYSLSTNMLLSGINLGPGYGKDIDVYYIKPISMKVVGPEIITEDVLEPGTTLSIMSIERSTVSIPFEGRRTTATVSVEQYRKAVEVPIEIDIEYLQSTNYMEAGCK